MSECRVCCDTDFHPGINCVTCKQHVIGVRVFCLRCEDVNFCESCSLLKVDWSIHPSHLLQHELLRIRDSRQLTEQKILDYKKRADEEIKKRVHDSFSFQEWRKEELKDDPVAFELIKKMLRKENEYRLGDTYLVEYAKSQKDGWKTKVTEDLQVRVVEEHQEEARNAGVYDNTRDGIKFLRAASGNYAHRIEEIKECANYVKYTHFCVRGPLKPGDYVDLTTFPLIHPDTEKEELLSSWKEPGKPLVIIASSYT